jgi:hypothetical protein
MRSVVTVSPVRAATSDIGSPAEDGSGGVESAGCTSPAT